MGKFVGMIRILQILFSPDQRWVEARYELKTAIKHDYVDPFKSGYNGTPMPPQPKYDDLEIIIRILVWIAAIMSAVIAGSLLLIHFGGN